MAMYIIGLRVRKFPPEIFRKFIPIFSEISPAINGIFVVLIITNAIISLVNNRTSRKHSFPD